MPPQGPILVLAAGELWLTIIHALKARVDATRTPISVLRRASPPNRPRKSRPAPRPERAFRTRHSRRRRPRLGGHAGGDLRALPHGHQLHRLRGRRVMNQVVFTAGETVTYRRLADVVEEVLGERLTREFWDVKFLEVDLLKDSDDAIKKYGIVFAKGRGVAWGLGKTFSFRNGIEVVGVEQWARTNLKK